LRERDWLIVVSPIRRNAGQAETYSLHIRVRAFVAFDEAVDPRGDDWQRDRAVVEHRIV
jgi:hypothetical protein